MGLHVVILAAGKGKRMISDLPKILHPLGGVPLLERVVNAAQSLQAEAIHVVYGNGGTMVRDVMDYLPVHWIEQHEQLGTGHAVLQALPFCQDKDQILVLFGDVPLISVKTLQKLLKKTPYNGLGLVVTERQDPTGFGRIIRDEMGNITAIIEHKDADEQTLKIKEINTGILTASAEHLKDWLPRVKNNNKQQEYYLTDIVALAVDDGNSVGGVMAHCTQEVQGVNDRWELAELERYYQRERARELSLSGVTVRDPARLDIRGQVDIAKDVVLDINVVMEGKVKIGTNSIIGPNVVLRDVEIGENVIIKANTVIEEAIIHNDAEIGPFARIRPQTIIDKGAKVGNFVEIKKVHLGANSKASHLTYLGDATIGKNVNIGAGTITCNYDGVNKWHTSIGDGAFIGSNSSLIAPLEIGANAYIAGGSTINKDAPSDKLTIARAKQITIKSWQPPSLQSVKTKE